MTEAIAVPARIDAGNPVTPGGLRRADPCIVVIFGASGDLSHRKLVPSLFHLAVDGALADDYAIVGVDRDDTDDEAFRESMHQAVREAFPDDAGFEQLTPPIDTVPGTAS